MQTTAKRFGHAFIFLRIYFVLLLSFVLLIYLLCINNRIKFDYYYYLI